MVILAIDPGTATTGYAVLGYERGAFEIGEYGVITTEKGRPAHMRLKDIYNAVVRLVELHSPDCFVVEELFFNTNVRTAISVGQARGVCLLAAANGGVPTAEYTPLQVKSAVVGYGKADKSQVQHMVKLLLKLDAIPKPDDAADALALAICHAHSAEGRMIRR
ncbi:MAG: crossover junction endodeoxyribonuclease RuvC [Actinobacteria bacterium]|nr:crossover junction endodeoxyribonuclease RuvC [Actinomycetota bacterium]